MHNRTVALLAGLAFVSACAPAVNVIRYQPPEVNLAPARTLALTVDADAPGLVTFLAALSSALNGQYGVYDASLATAPLRDALAARLDQDGRFRPAPVGEAQAMVHVQVNHWWQSELRSGPDDPLPMLTGELAATVTLTRPGTTPVVRELSDREAVVLNEFSVSVGPPPDQRLAQQVVGEISDQIAAMILPSPYSEKIALDDSADDDDQVLDLIQDGKLEPARALLTAQLVSDPYGPALHYNLGVIDELEGNLSNAEASYQRAQALAPNALHASAIERIRRAEQQTRALQASAVSG